MSVVSKTTSRSLGSAGPFTGVYDFTLRWPQSSKLLTNELVANARADWQSPECRLEIRLEDLGWRRFLRRQRDGCFARRAGWGAGWCDHGVRPRRWPSGQQRHEQGRAAHQHDGTRREGEKLASSHPLAASASRALATPWSPRLVYELAHESRPHPAVNCSQSVGGWTQRAVRRPTAAEAPGPDGFPAGERAVHTIAGTKKRSLGRAQYHRPMTNGPTLKAAIAAKPTRRPRRSPESASNPTAAS